MLHFCLFSFICAQLEQSNFWLTSCPHPYLTVLYCTSLTTDETLVWTRGSLALAVSMLAVCVRHLAQ